MHPKGLRQTTDEMDISNILPNKMTTAIFMAFIYPLKKAVAEYLRKDSNSFGAHANFHFNIPRFLKNECFQGTLVKHLND